MALHFHTVLYVDDDADDHQLFSEAIESMSEKPVCHFYFSAAKALQDLDEQRIKPDLIITDINMPLMNGLQFLIALKEREATKSIPVFVYSTSGDEPTRLKCEKLGVLGYHIKSCDFSSIISCLNTLLLSAAL